MKHSQEYYDWIGSYKKDKEAEDKLKKKKKRMTYTQLEEELNEKSIHEDYEVDDYDSGSCSTC